MITHISDIKLQTVSIEGVKQVYKDILSFPIKKETASFIQLISCNVLKKGLQHL